MAPMGYKVLSFPRLNGRNGGDIALVHQDYYTVKQLNKLPDNNYYGVPEFQTMLQLLNC